jgi:prophage antirepressor-like protein
MENNKTFHFQGKNIQIKVLNNEPWFLAADIARALTVKDPSRMIEHARVKEQNVCKIMNRTNDVHREMLFVDEIGLFKILMKSRKAVAEKFQDWVTEQVFPSVYNVAQDNVAQDNVAQDNVAQDNVTQDNLLPADYELPGDYELQLIKAKANLIQAQNNFYQDIVNSAIIFEDKGDLKLAAIIKSKLSNSVLIETKDESNQNLVTSVEDKLEDIPETAVEVSIRLGYKIPHNYESALGKAVKKKCADLLICQSSKYSGPNNIKLSVNFYPPNNKRVEEAVIEYCRNKGFSVQPSLSIVK